VNVLDLFSGIGGFSLGLERAGMKTVAFCEIDAQARKVLAKHWPDVPIFEDVSTLSKDDISEQIDVLAGGFPCQDISTAGRGAGLSGSRSGLWYEYHRIIKEIRPRYAVIENVSALRSRGLEQVLWSLSEIGYDAEWHCIPASALGAPHQRDRIWIVAYPASGRCESVFNRDTKSIDVSTSGSHVADADSAYSEGRRLPSGVYAEYANTVSAGWWEVEPSVGRVANGLPGQTHRLKQLGNAVVPQIPELIGRAIMEFERVNSLA
jgi:DNA (cytosine-5)-methyltransferase 1